jgi:signal transduction histidine kinase
METDLYPLTNLTKQSRQLPLSLRLKGYRARLSSINMWQLFLSAAMGLLLVYLIINVNLSSRWIGQPFAGFLHQNRTVTWYGLPGWQASELTIRPVKLEEGDLILKVNGQIVPSSTWLADYIRRQPPGQMVTYTFLQRNGQEAEVSLAVTTFRSRDFFLLVALPAFIAFIILLTAAVTLYLRVDLLAVRLITLFNLALICSLASFPGFMLGPLPAINLLATWAGKIIMPSLLLHFVLVMPGPKKPLTAWPFLLPLIYFPVLPGLVHLPNLFLEPETTRNFSAFINLITFVYAGVTIVLLLKLMLRTKEAKLQKQAFVLLLGLILPATSLLVGLIWSYSFINDELIYKNIEQYSLVGLPIAVVIAIIRYELFGIERINRTRFFYMGAIILALFSYFTLIVFTQPVATNLFQLQPGDLTVILATTGAFLLVRPLYRKTLDWLRQRTYGSTEDFRVGLRLFSHHLLTVKSRRELEALVSWDVVSDFRLRSAELAVGNRPTIPYAVALPLKVSNVFLGTLFIGTKINGTNFTAQELSLLVEMQKQIALALWSIELDEAIQSTEQLTRLKSKFLTNVTHELRTPLNAMINYIGFVIDDYRASLNNEQRRYLEQALQGAEKLLEIINNILDMSKIEAGQMRLYLQPVNLAKIISRLQPLIEEMIKDKPIQLIVDIAPDLPDLYGDQLRLRQIILNLLSNAAKFTQAGVIQLRCYPDNANIIIEVADTGIGIDEKTLPLIFQQFASTDLTDARRDFGPGLSLPIAKALAELHGGHLNLQSQSNKGAIFTLTLPIRRDQAE